MEYDGVIIGSGINSLVAGALLSRAGWRVAVFERNGWLGGAMRTAEITDPGFVHEVLSSWHPLFVGSPGCAALKDDLARAGVVYRNTPHPTATLFPDGRAAFLSTDHAKNVRHFDALSRGDGQAWDEVAAAFGRKADVSFGILGADSNLHSAVGLALKAHRALGRGGAEEYLVSLFASARNWLGETFASPEVKGLFAPWVLHTGLGPDGPGSAFMTELIGVAVEQIGMPVPVGGGRSLVEAFVRLIEGWGGHLAANTEVFEVVVEGGQATGVRLASGEVVRARRAVLANVTPTQLYLKLLASTPVPGEVLRKARRYRYGRADMQIHYALSAKPTWPGAGPLGETAIIHLTPGLDGVSRAVNEAERGLLPAEATIVLGQPMAVDPSRAPEGSWIFWVQLQELPSHPVGDAADAIPVEGSWTDDVRERYADRITARIAHHLPGFEGLVRKRVALSPADLEALDVNLMGGDPYSGDAGLDQEFLFRPFSGTKGHRTVIPRLYHIGASTHPGPGLHGTSGYLAASDLLRSHRWHR